MSTFQSVRPNTIDSIKGKAKTIRRVQQVSHLQALDIAARDSGFENYHHARRALQRTPGFTSLHSVFLSAYWRDTSTKPSSAGLEIIEVKFLKPLLSFLDKHRCSHARNLEGFYVEIDDHLEMRTNADSQQRARERLIRAALTLQFIQATGLRPVTTKVQRKAMNRVDDLPSSDHISRWISTATGDWIILDEPYSHVVEQPTLGRREAWIAANNLHWSIPKWGGLYYPGHAIPHLLSSNIDLLNEVVSAVESLPADVLGSDSQWARQSQNYWTQFVSPMRQASGKKRKPRLGTTSGFSKNAVEFQCQAGYKSRWRPQQPMSLESHIKVGAELKRLYVSDIPSAAHTKLARLQSTLEDWMFAESSLQPRDGTDVDVYYGGQSIQPCHGVFEQLAVLNSVQSTLVSSYLDCKPLRDELKGLDAARASISKGHVG